MLVGRICAVLDSPDDDGLTQTWKPCAAHSHRHTEIPVQVQERQFSFECGFHGVDDDIAFCPQRLDYGELGFVGFRLLPAEQRIIVAHPEIEVVRVHLAHVLTGVHDELFAMLVFGFDDFAVGPCHGIAVAMIVAFEFGGCADCAGNGLSHETVGGYDCHECLLCHI